MADKPSDGKGFRNRYARRQPERLASYRTVTQEESAMSQPDSTDRAFTTDTDRSIAQQLALARWFHCIRDDLRQLVAGRHVIHEFVSATLRVRYQRGFLGFFWTLLHPLLMLTVLSVVFSRILRFEMDNYPVFLFSGLIPWQFFSASLSNSSTSLLTNQGLIRRISVYLLLFPVSDLMVAVVNMVFAMIAMFILLMFLGAHVSVHLILVPVGLIFLFIFTLGVSLIAMTLTTFFRDFEHMISVLLQALFFATPIFYPTSEVPKLAPLLNANPLSWILVFFHDGLYYHAWPSAQTWIIASAASLSMLLVGYLLYKRYEHEYIFRL